MQKNTNLSAVSLDLKSIHCLPRLSKALYVSGSFKSALPTEARKQRAISKNHHKVVMASAAAPSSAFAATQIIDSGLPRSSVVGVLGGGQLGKMLAQEAVRVITFMNAYIVLRQ